MSSCGCNQTKDATIHSGSCPDSEGMAACIYRERSYFEGTQECCRRGKKENQARYHFGNPLIQKVILSSSFASTTIILFNQSPLLVILDIELHNTHRAKMAQNPKLRQGYGNVDRSECKLVSLFLFN